MSKSPYNMLKYATPADDTRTYLAHQIATQGGGMPDLSTAISNVGLGGVTGGAIGGIGATAMGGSPLHGVATGAGVGAGSTLGLMGGDALGRLVAPHLAELLAKRTSFSPDRIPGIAATTARGVGNAVGSIGGGVMGGLAGHFLTRPKHREEKEAQVSPMIAAFMDRCDQLGLNHNKQAAIACQLYPVLTEEFYKAGFLDSAHEALNNSTVGQIGQAVVPFGGVAGGTVGALHEASKGNLAGAVPHAANAAVSGALGMFPGGGMVAQAGKQIGAAAIGQGAQALSNHMSGAGA